MYSFLNVYKYSWAHRGGVVPKKYQSAGQIKNYEHVGVVAIVVVLICYAKRDLIRKLTC